MPHLNSTYSFSYYIPFLLPCVFQTFLPFSVYFFSFRLGFYVFDDYGPINVKTSLKHLLVARSLSQKMICMSCVPYVAHVLQLAVGRDWSESRWDECMLNKGERLAKRERA